MCKIVKQLLAEKLFDDFYDEQGFIGESTNTENLMNRLKTVLPAEQHDLMYRWEAAYAERCGEELRHFADYVAKVLMKGHRNEEDCEGCYN